MSAHALLDAPLGSFTASALGAAAVIVALLVLIRAARSFGLADDGSDAPQRKAQAHAVPLVGGPALALGAIVLAVAAGSWSGATAILPEIPADPWHFDAPWLALALVLALATGLVDDARPAGLAPLPKLAGQIAAGLALAFAFEGAVASPLARALVVFVAVAAQNVANTFDHADGMLGSAAFAACAGAGSSFAGALAAFLGFNLSRRRADGSPFAYLGDSGSHLLGIVLATSSLGHAALTLPALDLARVVVSRVRAGQPVWNGDRRHLGHRLRDAGRGPLATVAIAALCSAPAFAAVGFALHGAPARGLAAHLGALASGAVGCGILLAVVLRLHPVREPRLTPSDEVLRRMPRPGGRG